MHAATIRERFLRGKRSTASFGCCSRWCAAWRDCYNDSEHAVTRCEVFGSRGQVLFGCKGETARPQQTRAARAARAARPAPPRRNSHSSLTPTYVGLTPTPSCAHWPGDAYACGSRIDARFVQTSVDHRQAARKKKRGCARRADEDTRACMRKTRNAQQLLL